MTQEPKNANKSHIVIYAILGIVILGMALLCLQLYMQANAPQHTVTVVQQVPVNVANPADEASIKATIARELEKLAVKKPDAKDFTYQKVLDTRAAIKKGDYVLAKTIAQDVLTRSKIRNWDFYPFNIYMSDITDLSDPSYINHLNAWISNEKDQALPLILRAQYYYNAGWQARGGSFVRSIRSEHMDSFSDDMNLALADLSKVAELKQANPFSYYLTIRALASFGNSKALHAMFEDAISHYPNYYKLYSVVLDTLVPKWGGSIEELESFVEEYADKADEHSPLKMLYLEQYQNLIDIAGLACSEQDGTAHKNCIETYMARLVSPALEKKVATAFELYKYNNKFEFGRAIYPVLDNIISRNDTDKFSGALLQLAANAMDVQIQLRGNNPGHNNYILDLLAAHIWQRNSSFEEAGMKYNEALLDINNTIFPDEESKADGLTAIYENMAYMEKYKKNYVFSIAYQDAAYLASGAIDARRKQQQCEAYHKLNLEQQAIDVCSSVYQASGDFDALWNRAEAYRALHKTDEAISDLSVIAESEHHYRSAAVLLISIIYGDLKDHEKMRDILNKYDYSYDVETAGKKNVSVAYNNRCYAYMQLGELEKALADCTESLKYGSSPDTYQKQQKLIGMLKEKSK